MSANAEQNSFSGFEVPDGIEAWCKTRKSDDVHFKYLWEIENFSEEMRKPSRHSNEPAFGNENRLTSSEFTIVDSEGNKTKWKVLLYPNGEGVQSRGSVGIFLDSLNSNAVHAKFNFAIIDVNKKKRKRLDNSVFYEFVKSNRGWNRLVTHEFLKGPGGSELLPQDTLTVVCEVILKGSQKTVVSGYKNLVEVDTSSKPAEKWMGNFDFAFNDKAFSDVKIVCGDREFDCHRVILSSQSSVFRAMFQHDMAEAQNRRVEIKELKPAVVHAMLKYVYTGDKTKSEMTTPGEMLVAADMYDLEDLKAHCEEVLIRSMQISNCIDCLVLGDMNNAPKLKRNAMKLVVINLSSVVKSKEWKEKLISLPVLMSEVMENVGGVSQPPKKKARHENASAIRTPAK